MNKVAVIDYGMGNLHSVAKAVEFAATEAGETVALEVTGDGSAIAAADRVILPGVGAIRDCMAEIRRLNVGEMVAEAMQSKPLLAICVGMQALLHHSEENGGVECLGLLQGEVKGFGNDLQNADGARLKVPHIGWSRVEQCQKHPLWQGIENGARFYFVHGFYVSADTIADVRTRGSTKVLMKASMKNSLGKNPDIRAGLTDYGIRFVSALTCGNIFATQFHPEKSQRAGLTLLRNFLRWDGA